jgi:hypothetical protein
MIAANGPMNADLPQHVTSVAESDRAMERVAATILDGSCAVSDSGCFWCYAVLFTQRVLTLFDESTLALAHDPEL